MSETTNETRQTSNTQGWISAVAALLGTWLLVSVFVFDPIPEANFWNDVIVGGAIATIAGYNAVKSSSQGISASWSGLVALLGLWMIIAPFLFETTGAASFWSDVISGLLVAVLAGYNAYAARETARRTTTAEPESR
ncbi:SPW repeat protein [Halorussus halophilus]|uniref:SPW repeat protein n=1 Tax=Halorussus halophilus TaxID=2650975 RepID=UPI00130154DF|nr:SPW repeat protein [Halorussus halophilus]